MNYIKLTNLCADDEDHMEVIVNVDHIEWITDHFDYTEISLFGGDNSLSVMETTSEILQKIANAKFGVH